MKTLVLTTAVVLGMGLAVIPEAEAARRNGGCPSGTHLVQGGACISDKVFRYGWQGKVHGNWQGAASGRIWTGDPHPYWGPAWHSMWGY